MAHFCDNSLMNFKNFRLFSATDIAAVGTWGVVFAITLYFLPQSSEHIQRKAPFIILLFLVYIGCFLFINKGSQNNNSRKKHLFFYFIQLASAFALMLLWPLDFLPILSIIWAAMLPHFFSRRSSFLITCILVITWFSARGLVWGEKGMIIQGLLYSTFHFFAVLMTLQTKIAETATQKAQSLNKELQATQQLLAEASKQNERTRIARDLHDLLGHHLTALIINLQVAGHVTKGDAQEKINQCHSLAKLLLSDVREAVSTLRDNQNLDFRSLVDMMIDNVPRLRVHSDISADLKIDDLNLAKALLSCIQEAVTNSLRHANANEFWLSISDEDGKIHMELYDNGQITSALKEGNGLQGMRERVTEMKGRLEFKIVQNALQITIEIPHLVQ